MNVKQGLKTAYNKPLNRENASGKYWRESCGKVEFVAFLMLWWWYNVIIVRQKGKERQMLTTLEILQLAQVGLQQKIIGKKRLINMRKHKGKPTKLNMKQLDELNKKYDELNKRIQAEYNKMI